LKERDARREEKDRGVGGRAVEHRYEREEESVGGHGSKCKVGDKEGGVMKDGKSGKERVWDVERSGGEEDLEVWRRGGDDGDSVFVMEFFIRDCGVYSKPWVGPRRKGRVRGKGIKGGKRQCFSDCREDREGRKGMG